MEFIKKLASGKKPNHDVQVLQIPIPTSIVMKYLPQMLMDMGESEDE